MKKNKVYLKKWLYFMTIIYSVGSLAQEKTDSNYSESAAFLSCSLNQNLGTPPSLTFDKEGNTVVFQRKTENSLISPEGLVQKDLILIFDKKSNKLIESWGKNHFKKPHGLYVDSQNNIWVTDVILQQVFKFSHEGKMLMELGEKNVAGNDLKHFDQPTDIAVSTDGFIYVTDGYGNNRVVKFSAEGKYLFEWGSKGKEPGQFNLPHGIDIDNKGNIYVADRENNRIQMFDSTGDFIQLWTDSSFGAIQSLELDPEKSVIYAVDYKLNKDDSPLGSDIIIIDIKTGKFQKIIPIVQSFKYIGKGVKDNIYPASLPNFTANVIHKIPQTFRNVFIADNKQCVCY